MTTTVKKLAALLVAAAAIAAVGTSSAALADGRNKELRASERHYDSDHRYFHYGHYFDYGHYDYGSDCYWVYRPYGVVKVCPDAY